MSSKKFIAFVGLFAFLIVGFVGGVNYVVDPFNIFHTKFLKEQFQRNERFMKIEYLEENHSKFNSYMFGSSRIGTTPPSVIDRYVKDAKFYNFTISSANLYDYLMHLKYFIKRGYPLHNLYIQIDIDNMNNFGRIDTDYLRKFHPFVKNEKLYNFYIAYLTGFFPFNIKGKVQVNIKQDDLVGYFIETGIWTRPKKEENIKINPLNFIKNEPSFNTKNLRNVKNTQSKNNLEALKEIASLSKKHGVNLIIFTTPHNKNMMDTFIIDDYLEFLKTISRVGEFYDFSGYNSITINNMNYYESSHYRENVGRLIAAKIFNDQTVDVPKDFGVLVTKENIEEHLQNLKEQIKAYDLN
ncbi:hypothetical protein [Sulfurimonas sp.]|uniref:hypothetical protein n=1 Tax=Sulfurimonas sp. TaxID=2022749 RepID=UPI001A0388C4|nr:hypothetical protein [Sulfurimonas sp.]MBE0513324.1 hypothetical protein [Sulfurimonas sp.]